MPANVLSRMHVANICNIIPEQNNQFKSISQHMANDPFWLAVSKFLDTSKIDIH